jgi:hypothetical protein
VGKTFRHHFLKPDIPPGTARIARWHASCKVIPASPLAGAR